jgi:uridine kinase
VTHRTMPRAELIARLSRLLASRRLAHPLRVAIDGPDAAGKSTLAAELAHSLGDMRETILSSVDGFHRPRHIRQRRGSLSPEGYYQDAFDYDAIIASVLRPLGPGGSRRYRTAMFDYRTDTARTERAHLAAKDAVLLFDGVFALRPELQSFWDVTMVVEVSPDETIRRALTRDVDLFGTPESVRERYQLRYLPAQQIYRAEASPATRADIVIDNNDPPWPRLLKWPAAQRR